jgi:hypothetical protein
VLSPLLVVPFPKVRKLEVTSLVRSSAFTAWSKNVVVSPNKFTFSHQQAHFRKFTLLYMIVYILEVIMLVCAFHFSFVYMLNFMSVPDL